jgi:hypothetical protein
MMLVSPFLMSLHTLFHFTHQTHSHTTYSNLKGELYDQDDPAPLIKEYRIYFKLIPKLRMPLIKFLFEFLFELQKYSDQNMMTPSNLGIVFGPNLIRPQQQTQV